MHPWAGCHAALQPESHCNAQNCHVTGLSAIAATKRRSVILPDDFHASIDGCQPFAGVTPMITPMQKD
jgi:hypothetical protein